MVNIRKPLHQGEQYQQSYNIGDLSHESYISIYSNYDWLEIWYTGHPAGGLILIHCGPHGSVKEIIHTNQSKRTYPDSKQHYNNFVQT